ncbi:tetratricopeptide repeat protein [Escherichia coli]|uniref:tetratricopeptide repeat protein n=1 Tax=Escherichia coli TaxID=562 RepID=UPI0019212B83|nr:tetratricopeptide repeat protein [Escherichia coli]
MENVDQNVKGNIEMIATLEKALGMGASLAELHGITTDTLESMYSIAFDFYQKEKLEEAELFFKFLCIYDFKNSNYLKGYAAVCQLQKKYEKALELYHMSLNMNNECDFSIIYHIGQCLMGLKKIESAMECFKVIIEYCEDENLKDLAQTYIELFTKNND